MKLLVYFWCAASLSCIKTQDFLDDESAAPDTTEDGRLVM